MKLIKWLLLAASLFIGFPIFIIGILLIFTGSFILSPILVFKFILAIILTVIVYIIIFILYKQL